MKKKRFKPVGSSYIKDEEYPYAKLDREGASQLLNEFYDENQKMKEIFKDIVGKTEATIGKEKSYWAIKVVLDVKQYGIIQEVIR